MAVAENTAARVQNGTVLTIRFEDILNPKPVDNRTGEEIAADVIRRAGLKLKGVKQIESV